MALLSRFFGRTASEGAAYAFGVATGPVLAPATETIRQEAWQRYPERVPLVGLLAEGVAQGQVDRAEAESWAAKQGINTARFAAMVDIANIGPALGMAYAAWRRGELTDADFQTAVKRQGIEDHWLPALKALKQNPLDPSIIANAVHRGIMRDPSLIVREPPTTPGHVEQVPPSTIDPATEAAWSGMDHERLRVEVGTAGLPPGTIQMLQLLNRGEVTEDDVRRAVSQSNLRNEYMDVILALRRRLLTPHEYQEAALRGVLPQADADAGAALSGMEPADAHLLFEIMGRPLAVHQITTGLARGGTYGGTYTDVPEPYRDAIRRSNIRPEYARLAYANRYSYPGAFVLRALAQAGELGTAADVEAILLDIGWPPDLAAKVAPSWIGGGTATDPHVTKAQTQLWNTTHKSYIAEEIGDAEATARMTTLGIPAASQTTVLGLWGAERSLIRSQLSLTQLKKAYQGQVINPATGAAWSQADVTAALLDRGYSQADAQVIIAEW